MSKYLTQWIHILTLATTYVGETETAAPPTRAERDKADAALRHVEDDIKKKTTLVQDSTTLRTQLDKTVDAMEKAYTPFAREAGELAALAKLREEELAKKAADPAVTATLVEQAKAAQEEAARMKTTLDKFKEVQKKAREDAEKGTTDIHRLKRELQDALGTYFKTADPKMIAERYNLPLDGNFSFDLNTEFMRRTKNTDAHQSRLHYGMGAEHTWDDRYYIPVAPFLGRTITLKSIAQHEQVTTRFMFDKATELLQRSAPGVTAPVARFGMNVNDGDLQTNPEAYKAVFGHPVDAFRPTVINNSTRSSYSLEKEDTFQSYMETFTRGPGTTTIKSDNGTITYGLPPISRPIIGNASGNDKWGHAPDPSWIKNFHPNHINIGVSAIPAQLGATVRDDAATSHIEEYSTQNSGVLAIIQRPRWNKDGTAIKTQYLNPEYERILEDNLWRLTGRQAAPTAEELDDETKCAPGLIKAVQTDKESLLGIIRRNEGTDANGTNANLRGTSFAAPTAGGVLLAASILYPDASNAELIDAFCSSCVPILHRDLPTSTDTNTVSVQDVTYLTDEKTGRIYSPMAGFGEFTMKPDATKDKPDSWLRMTERLEAMQQERNLMTKNGRQHTQVDIGEGANRRRVAIDGQPLSATIELNKGKAFTSAQATKAHAEAETRIIESLRDIDRYNDSSHFLSDTPAIMGLVRSHEFAKALNMLQTDYKFKSISGDDIYLSAAEDALRAAVRETGHSYNFTVQESQDVCCTQTALRVRFADRSNTDNHIVIESPDGTRIPATLSALNDGIAVTSTPGFMRQSAKGMWKIYSRSELDMDRTTLVINGTERNPAQGIVDVRETILPRFEKKEERHKAIPAQNTMQPIASPFPLLHEAYNSGTLPTPPARAIAPSTRQQFQENLQKFIEGSELRKGGYVPEGQLEKTSMLEPRLPRNKAEGIASEIGAMLAAAGCAPESNDVCVKLPINFGRKAEPLMDKRSKAQIA